MRQAFSMLEILIAILIIGIGASLVMPRLTRRAPSTDWDAIELELNTLLYFARQEAVTTQKVHRVVIDKRRRAVEVEVQPAADSKKFEPARSAYFTSQYELPQGLAFESMKRGRKNIFAEHRGIAYCYVMPNGLVQEGELTLSRHLDGEESVRTVKVEPFLGEWRTL